MREIKKGDIVTRNSYGNDIVFAVKRILKLNNDTKIAILKGIDVRVEADAPIEDLKLLDKEEQERYEEELDKRINNKIKNAGLKKYHRIKEIVYTGKILHLDGDKKYSEKSMMYYKKMGLKAIVKNIPENKQPKAVYRLLSIYNPDILVITGHDGMIKNGARYNDIYNYRNSRHFIETVKEARRYDEKNNKNLVIFAGACQSYFEALMEAGANFASSPARILIDFLDPLIVAKSIAIADKNQYITIDDFVDELRDGKKGINGLGARGKKNIIFI